MCSGLQSRECKKSSSSAGSGLGWRTLCFGSQVQGKISEAIIADTDEWALNGLALVAMVKSSNLRNRHDTPAFWLLNSSRLRSVPG
jgi:hypothetical protein